jgi:hypothetical protein
MKYLLVFLLTGCVTAQADAPSHRIDKHEMLICRTMCDKNVKSYTPMTGECECYQKK